MVEKPYFSTSRPGFFALSLVLTILCICFSSSKIFMYIQTPLSLFLTFVDTACFSLSIISVAPKRAKCSQSLRLARLHG